VFAAPFPTAFPAEPAELTMDEGVAGAGPDRCGQLPHGGLEFFPGLGDPLVPYGGCGDVPQGAVGDALCAGRGGGHTAVVDQCDLAEGRALVRVQHGELLGQLFQGGAPRVRVPLQRLLQAAAGEVLDDRGVRGEVGVRGVGVQEAGGADADGGEAVVRGGEEVEAGAG
jgi:hypothetical protein